MRLRANMIQVSIVFCLLFNLSGCWSAEELNNLAIVTALAIDKTNDKFLVTIQIVNPRKVAAETQSTRTSVSTYAAEGDTIFEALRRITTDAPRKLYLAHIRIVVIGETLAEAGVGKAMDFLSRDHEVRTDFFLVVSKETSAAAMLRILTPMENIPANKVALSLETSEERWAPTKTVMLDEFINGITSDGKQPVITGIERIGPDERGNSLNNVQHIEAPVNIKVNNVGAFKGDRLVGWLSEEESKGYNYTQGNAKNTVVSLACKDGKIGIEITKIKKSVKAIITKDQPEIKIEIKLEGNVGDVACNIDLSKESSLAKLEQKVNKRKQEIIEQSVKRAQEDFQSDIFGFGEAIHRKDPKLWKKLKANWDDEHFPTLPVSITVTTKLKRLGTITNSFQNQISGD